MLDIQFTPKLLTVVVQSNQCDNHNVAMSAPTESSSTVEADRRVSEDSTVKENAPPANAVSAAPKKKEPPPESQESIRLRAYVIASFWAIVIFIGLPIWWRTTAIYRASLPVDEMMEWADGRVCCNESGRLVLMLMPMLVGMPTSLSLTNIHRSRVFAGS